MPHIISADSLAARVGDDLGASDWVLVDQDRIDRFAAAGCPDTTQRDAVGDVARVFAAWYPLQAAKDVPFELGRVCMGLRDFAGAVDFFRKSNDACGEHHQPYQHQEEQHQEQEQQ